MADAQRRLLPQAARRSRTRRLLLSAIATFVTVVSLTVVPPPAAAAACGGWAPGGGVLTARKQGSTFIVRTVFRFSPAEIQALHNCGSRGMEVDVIAYGGSKRGGDRQAYSNLPGPYLDTEFNDDYPRVLTIGTDEARSLRANVDYYTEIRYPNVKADQNRAYAELYLNFQRVKRAFCVGGPAFCNHHEGPAVLMKSQLAKNPRISLSPNKFEDVDSVAWGHFRQPVLHPGQRLAAGDKIYSPNNLNYLVMQSDGNLVEYIPGGRAVWASNTFAHGSVFAMQADGNSVIYAPGNRPVWSTGTRVRNSVLEIQNDRNVVVYAPRHVAVWANDTAGKP